MDRKIGLIRGDGIGPEIVDEAKKVLDRVAGKYGHSFEYTDIIMGGCSIDRFGIPLTDDAIEKYYRATSYISNHNSGVMTDSYVRLTNYMYVDRHTNLSRLCDKSYSIAKEALLDYMERDYSIADLDIRLITGRHHQIRLQLSGAGMPILGDLKYGSEESMAYSASHGIHRIQLCAYKLKFSHPATDMDMLFTI